MRFSQPDVVRGYALNPQTVNRYAYCVNNPVMYADPSGESYTSGVGGAWSRTASILIDDYVQVAPSTVNSLVRAAKQTVGNGGASASERRIKASIKAAQEEIRQLNIFRRTYDIERELIGRRACAQLLGDEARAAEYEAELEFVQAHTYQDILFLVGIDYLGVELSMEVRLSILERLKANEGGLEAEDLQELGLYTEYRNVAAEMAALLEASYCGSRFEQTLYSIDELHRADRQAEVQMFLRFFGNMAIMASVQDYNAAGSAIRMPGATRAEEGYESGPDDGKPFNYEGSQYETSESPQAESSPMMDIEDLPSNVQDSYKRYDDAGWKGNVSGQTKGTHAGKIWENDSGQLPRYDDSGNMIIYREFDVNNKIQGMSRDGERFIVGSDGSVWYTDSHYGDHASINGTDDFVRIK